MGDFKADYNVKKTLFSVHIYIEKFYSSQEDYYAEKYCT